MAHFLTTIDGTEFPILRHHLYWKSNFSMHLGQVSDFLSRSTHGAMPHHFNYLISSRINYLHIAPLWDIFTAILRFCVFSIPSPELPSLAKNMCFFKNWNNSESLA